MKSYVRSGLLTLLVVASTALTTIAQEEAEKEKKRTPDVVFVPTPNDVVAKMLDLAKVGRNDVVYDLGCGDGRIVVTAAKKFGAKGIGFDINPVRVQESQENIEKNKVRDLVEVKEQDIFEVDLRPASVVTLYLLPELNKKLIPQFDKMKPGSRIVSHAYDMDDAAEPEQVVSMRSKEDGSRHTIYLYTIPLKKKEEAE